jgi:hypothetical protein
MSDIEQTEDYQVNTYLTTEARVRVASQQEGCLLYIISSFLVAYIAIYLESMSPIIIYLVGFFIFPALYTAVAVKALRDRNLTIVQNPRITPLETTIGGYILSGGTKSYIFLLVGAVIIYFLFN